MAGVFPSWRAHDWVLRVFLRICGHTPGDAYARQCAPFSSGLMTTGPQPKLKHDQERIDSFVGWIVTQGGHSALLHHSPERARVLVVVARRRVDADYAILRELARHKISFDVLYATPDWNEGDSDAYERVVVDRDLPLPATDRSKPLEVHQGR